MSSTPTRRRASSRLLGLLTVVATLFSGLVATPAVAIPTTHAVGAPQSIQQPDPEHPNVISGIVTDGNGDPMVHLLAQVIDPVDYLILEGVFTDETGYFEFTALSAGDYKIQFADYDEGQVLAFFDNADSYNNADHVTISDTEGAYIEMVIEAPAEVGTIQGVVENAANESAAGVTVQILSPEGDVIREGSAGDLGSYVFSDVPVGTYTACFSGEGFVDACYGGAPDFGSAETFELTTAGYDLGEFVMVAAGSITGRVWPDAASDTGLDGVIVSAYAFNGWYWSSVASTETDLNGFYELTGLAADTYYVVADPELQEPTFQPEWYPNGIRRELSSSLVVESGVTTSNINFALNEGGSISVTAYCGSTETICEYAYIAIDALDGTLPESSRSYGGISTTRVFEGLPDGRYQVRMWTDSTNETYVGGDGSGQSAEIITISGGQEVTGVFHVFDDMTLPVTISGSVLGADQLRVALVGEPRYVWEDSVVVDETSTDDSGNFEFTAQPGRYTLQFGDNETYDDDGNMRMEPSYLGGAYRLSRAEWVDVDSDWDLSEITLPTRDATVSGTIKNNASPAVGQTGVIVTLTSVNGTASTVTTAGGAYSISGLAPGLYTLSMEREGLTSTWNPAVASRPTINAVSATGNYTLNGTMAVARATVNGRVTGSGAAITDLTVYVAARRKTDDCPVATTEADEEGYYSLTDLPAGTFTVTASTTEPAYCSMSGGFMPTPDSNWIPVSRDATVTATQTVANHNLALGVGAKIRGTVRDSSGELFTDSVNVAVYGLNDEFIGFGDVESDGTYEVLGLPAGAYYVQVWESPTSGPAWWTNGTNRRMPVTVTAAQTLNNINLTAAANSTIEGVIASDNGGPVVGDIQAYDVLGLPVGYGNITDSSTGEYEIPGLPDGPIRIKFTVSGQDFWVGGGTSLATAGVTYVGGGGTTVARELTIPNLGSVSGDATVAGLGEAGEVTLIDSRGRVLSTVDTSNGSYAFANVAPGLYTVRYASENREIVWYGNKDSLAAATYFSVQDGGVVENINLNAVAATSAFVPGAVTTTGTLKVGQVLTAKAGTWTPTPTAIQYRWSTSWDDVPVSTAATYTLSPADIGKNVRLEIIISKAGVASESMFINMGVVQAAALTTTPTPTIAPATAPKVGTVLTAKPGTWSPSGVGFTYQWLRGGVPILGATGSTYTTTADDLGSRISVTIVGIKAGYTGVVKTSAQLAATVAATLTTKPTPTVAVTGGKQPGGVLTATAGSWAPAPVGLNFQWKRGGTAIPGATSPTYTLTSEDVGTSITVAVTGSKSGFTSVTTTSAAVTGIASGVGITGSTPTITGNKIVGALLTASAGTWSDGATISYQWMRNGKAILGATSSTYRLVSSDLHASIRVRVKGTLEGSTLVKHSSATSIVQPGTLTAPETYEWSGDYFAGGTVVADTVNLGVSVTVTYQWLRDGNPIPGATKKSYVLSNRDYGFAISVEITAKAKGYTTLVFESSSAVLLD